MRDGWGVPITYLANLSRKLHGREGILAERGPSLSHIRQSQMQEFHEVFSLVNCNYQVQLRWRPDVVWFLKIFGSQILTVFFKKLFKLQERFPLKC